MALYRVIWVIVDQPMSGMLPQLSLHLHYLICTSLCPISHILLSLNISASPGLHLSWGTESLFNGIMRQLNQAIEECRLHHRTVWPPCTTLHAGEGPAHLRPFWVQTSSLQSWEVQCYSLRSQSSLWLSQPIPFVLLSSHIYNTLL